MQNARIDRYRIIVWIGVFAWLRVKRQFIALL